MKTPLCANEMLPDGRVYTLQSLTDLLKRSPANVAVYILDGDGARPVGTAALSLDDQGVVQATLNVQDLDELTGLECNVSIASTDLPHEARVASLNFMEPA